MKITYDKEANASYIHMGKGKIFKGRPGVRSDWKKAIVSLVEGHKIDVTTGL